MNGEALGNRMDESDHLPDGWRSIPKWGDDDDVFVLDKWGHADPTHLETDRNTLGKKIPEKRDKGRVLSAECRLLSMIMLAHYSVTISDFDSFAFRPLSTGEWRVRIFKSLAYSGNGGKKGDLNLSCKPEIFPKAPCHVTL